MGGAVNNLNHPHREVGGNVSGGGGSVGGGVTPAAPTNSDSRTLQNMLLNGQLPVAASNAANIMNANVHSGGVEGHHALGHHGHHGHHGIPIMPNHVFFYGQPPAGPGHPHAVHGGVGMPMDANANNNSNNNDSNNSSDPKSSHNANATNPSQANFDQYLQFQQSLRDAAGAAAAAAAGYPPQQQQPSSASNGTNNSINNDNNNANAAAALFQAGFPPNMTMNMAGAIPLTSYPPFSAMAPYSNGIPPSNTGASEGQGQQGQGQVPQSPNSQGQGQVQQSPQAQNGSPASRAMNGQQQHQQHQAGMGMQQNPYNHELGRMIINGSLFMNAMGQHQQQGQDLNMNMNMNMNNIPGLSHHGQQGQHGQMVGHEGNNGHGHGGEMQQGHNGDVAPPQSLPSESPQQSQSQSSAPLEAEKNSILSV